MAPEEEGSTDMKAQLAQLPSPASPPTMEGLEDVLLRGNLRGLSEPQRLEYYKRVCASTGLNPLTQPFEYLDLQGRTVLYARRAATEQLRQMHKVSVTIVSRETVAGIYVVTAQARTPDGRVDESIGAVPIENLRGEVLANAFMKGETKAKRRVTLAICGLSFLDESELDTLPQARPLPIPVSARAETPSTPWRPADASQAAPKAAPESRIERDELAETAPPQTRELIVDMYRQKLEACQTADQLAEWIVALTKMNHPEPVLDVLRAMFRRHAQRLGIDPALVSRQAALQGTPTKKTATKATKKAGQ